MHIQSRILIFAATVAIFTFPVSETLLSQTAPDQGSTEPSRSP